MSNMSQNTTNQVNESHYQIFNKVTSDELSEQKTKNGEQKDSWLLYISAFTGTYT